MESPAVFDLVLIMLRYVIANRNALAFKFIYDFKVEFFSFQFSQQINSTLWKFFYGIYGGGPIVVLRGNMEEITRPIVPIPQNPNRERDERNAMDSASPVNDAASTNNGIVKDGTSLIPPQNSTVSNPPRESSNLIESTSDGKIDGRTTTFNQILSNQATIVKKATKNVSFEDNDSNSSDRESSTLIEQSFSIRRGKHHYSTSPNLASGEILSKKDRRLRSIKANGFFGLEGNGFTQIYTIFLYRQNEIFGKKAKYILIYFLSFIFGLHQENIHQIANNKMKLHQMEAKTLPRLLTQIRSWRR